MEKEELLKLIQAGESSRVEFKAVMPSPEALSREIVAFANSKGGCILIGINDSGSVKGAEVTPEAIEKVTYVAQNLCRPSVPVEVKTVKLDGKSILVLDIPYSHSKPHLTEKGEIYVRRGIAVQGATSEDTASMYRESGLTSFEESPVPQATLEDLVLEEFESFLDHRGFDQAKVDVSAEELLVDLRFAQRQEGKVVPTVAGLLLFGKYPQRFLPQSTVEIVRFQGRDVIGSVIDRAELQGPLTTLIEEALGFMEKHMRVAAKIEGFERKDIPEYPIEAVKDAIVNAVAHRDYSLRGGRIQILMFDDRWEVVSPGGLPGPVTVEGIERERFNRNPIIADALRTLRYMDGMGVGINRMKYMMRNDGFREPVFTETDNSFRVIFYGSLESQRMQMTLSRCRDILARSGGNERQLQALEHLSSHKAITNREYRELTGVTAMTALRDLKKLVEMGIIRRLGRKKGSYYILAEAMEQ